MLLTITHIIYSSSFVFLFFFNDTATTEIYTLSLHDALPICFRRICAGCGTAGRSRGEMCWCADRKSTRLNSSHANISYAVFCLKKKKRHSAIAASLVLGVFEVLFHLPYFFTFISSDTN